ncbi:hypothetical protein MFRU_001g05520 [Monilinia fructicola]|nr:hypothetical protein MFRU_001g05520 [Monilinia fructicola]
MADLPNESPYPSSAIEAVAATIDEFIDQLQLTWAINSAKGVTLHPGSRLAREIELQLIRTVGITVAPEEIYNRIGMELNRLVHQVDRTANPLFHDILVCCYRLMEGWHDQGLFHGVQSIADSVRDAVELEQRRRVVAYGPPSVRDLQRIQRMERTMAVDHKLRGDIEAYIERLEAIIAGFPAEEENDDDAGIDRGRSDNAENNDGNGDVETGEKNSDKAV